MRAFTLSVALLVLVTAAPEQAEYKRENNGPKSRSKFRLPVEARTGYTSMPGVLVRTADQGNSNINYIKLSQDLFNAQNRARRDPLSFAKELEAAGHLKAASNCRNAPIIPMPNAHLQYVPQLRQASRLLWEMQGPIGALGHTGPDGSSPYDRMNMYGRWRFIAGENIMVS